MHLARHEHDTSEWTPAERWLAAELAALHELIRDNQERLMTAIADVPAQLEQAATELNDNATSLNSAADRLEAAVNSGQTIDLSGMQAALASNNAAVQRIAAIVPAPVVDAPVDPSVTQ